MKKIKILLCASFITNIVLGYFLYQNNHKYEKFARMISLSSSSIIKSEYENNELVIAELTKEQPDIKSLIKRFQESQKLTMDVHKTIIEDKDHKIRNFRNQPIAKTFLDMKDL